MIRLDWPQVNADWIRADQVSKEWDEAKHPRDHGKFTSAGGSGADKPGVYPRADLQINVARLAQARAVEAECQRVFAGWDQDTLDHVSSIEIMPHEVLNYMVGTPDMGTVGATLPTGTRGGSQMIISSAIFDQEVVQQNRGNPEYDANPQRYTGAWTLNHELAHAWEIRQLGKEPYADLRQPEQVAERMQTWVGEKFTGPALSEIMRVSDYGASAKAEAFAEAVAVYKTTGREAGPESTKVFKQLGLFK